MGNTLVITTPKENGGIATLDITDPVNPITLAAILPPKSYIGGFFRHYVFLQSPVRAWDVLTDPTTLGGGTAHDTPVGTLGTPGSEYMSFGDDYMFLGHLRPDGGASKIDVADPKKMAFEGRVWGRLDIQAGQTAAINDDQFTVAIGPLLVMGDDQGPTVGSVIGVHSATPDTKPPIVDTVIPARRRVGQSAKSRIGISFSDNIELATVNAASFIVRPVGGQALPGDIRLLTGASWTSTPPRTLRQATTRSSCPEGGVTDFVGNGVPSSSPPSPVK